MTTGWLGYVYVLEFGGGKEVRWAEPALLISLSLQLGQSHTSVLNSIKNYTEGELS